MAALAGVSRAAPPMAGRCGCSWAWRTRQGLDIHGRLLSLAASPAFPPVAPLRPCAPARPHGNPPRPSSPTGTEAPEYQCASLLPSTSALLPSPASVPSYKDAGRLFRCLRRAKGRPPRRCFLLAPRASSSATSPDESAHDGSAEGGKVSGHRNRFLDLARLGAVVEGAAEAFFGSEIRRRLAITAVLIMLSRVGYFAPLPTGCFSFLPSCKAASRNMELLSDFTYKEKPKKNNFQCCIFGLIDAAATMDPEGATSM